MLRWIKKLMVAGLLFVSFDGFAQMVSVVNEMDNRPVEQATIQEVGTDRAAITNGAGQASLAGFSEDGTLLIRHPSFRPKEIKYSALSRLNYIVRLTEEVIQMGDVVISANKWEQNKREIPQRITEFKALEIAQAEPATAADLLSMNGQVFIQKSQLGGGSPIIRGFSANSVLIVVDGVRMNNAIFRSGNLQNVITLDPNNLQEAEVVFGPSSVIYGSDALGGVMDFHSKNPEFSPEGATIQGEGFTRYASAANALTSNIQLQLNLPKFASFTSVTYNNFDDLRTGSNRTDEFPDFGKRLEYVARIAGEDQVIQNDDVNLLVNSGYDQWNFLQKFRWRMGSFSDFTYSLHHSTSSDVPRYDRLTDRTNGSLTNAEWYYGPQEWQMHSLQSRFFYPTKLFDQLKMTTALQRVTESRNERRFGSDLLRSRRESVDVLSFNVDFEKSYGFTGELYYGLEAVLNDVESSAQETNIVSGDVSPTSTRYPDGGSSFNTLAAYISTKNHLNETLILSTGLRYSYTSLNAQFVDDTFFDFPFDEINLKNGGLTGNIGLVYLPKPGWKLNALLSSGFRAPNVDDAGKVFDSEPGAVVVPNPDLKPETSYNIEYGISRTFDSELKIDFVNYYSFLRDALVRRPFTFDGNSQIQYDGTLSNVFAEVNVGEAFIWGISLNISAQLYENITLKSSFTYTDGEDTIENLPLRHVTPLFGETSITLTQKKFRSSLIVRYSGGVDFEDLAPSEQNKPQFYTSDGALPWSTLNLNNSYQINDRFSVNLNLENILDTHYRTYSSGISAPGFNAIVSLRAKF
ncbi:TonB-dependent receptor [Roseivirga sp.]|uniref:TonB-dependent receptor n=1 Tax=Roseivirga sp. TaxID=1964215 RepID=UPI003B8CB852